MLHLIPLQPHSYLIYSALSDQRFYFVRVCPHTDVEFILINHHIFKYINIWKFSCFPNLFSNKILFHCFGSFVYLFLYFHFFLSDTFSLYSCLVYVLTDPSTCHLSQPRDFCCISTESKQVSTAVQSSSWSWWLLLVAVVIRSTEHLQHSCPQNRASVLSRKYPFPARLVWRGNLDQTGLPFFN